MIIVFSNQKSAIYDCNLQSMILQANLYLKYLHKVNPVFQNRRNTPALVCAARFDF